MPKVVEIGSVVLEKRIFLISSMYFHNFVIISPLKRVGPFIWTNLNSLHPRMLCAKFGRNWLSGSVDEDFLISSMYFHYFVIISLWKRAGPPFEQTWIPFIQGCFVPSLVEIGKVMLEMKMKMWKFTDGRTDRRRTTGDQKISLELQLRWAKNRKLTDRHQVIRKTQLSSVELEN